MTNLSKDSELQEVMSATQDIMNSRRVTAGWANIVAMYNKDIRTIEILDKNKIKVIAVVRGEAFEFICVREV